MSSVGDDHVGTWIVVALFTTSRGGEVEEVALLTPSKVVEAMAHPEDLLREEDHRYEYRQGIMTVDKLVVKNTLTGWQHTIDASEGHWIGEHTAARFRRQGVPAVGISD